MNKRTYLVIILCFGLFAYFSTGLKGEQPAEDLEVVTGFGGDIEKIQGSQVLYIAPSSVYTFGDGEKISSTIRKGEAFTPGETRENRQLISNKQYILGLEKVYIMGENIATYGLTSSMEVFFRNPYTNDSGYVAVCHGKPEEILKYRVEGYPSSSDYIEGMLKNANRYNFFPSYYKISDIFLSLISEGKNITLPYIDIVNDQLKMTGLSIFKKDKMIGKLNIDDAKIFNMLSETDGKGMVKLQTNPKQYLDYYAKVKRKVKVSKVENNYKFLIDLKFTGDIVSNTLYNDVINNETVNKEIQIKLENTIKRSCEDFIEKMKNQYKVDSLQLGQYAAGKYGRQKGIDWDEAVTKSDIQVNVKVQIDKSGRGDYFWGDNNKKH